MNIFIATGRLTKDPEYMESKDGKPYCRFSVACKRGYSKGKDNNVDFFDCTAFQSTAELIAKYCKKGAQVALQGSLEISSYTDRTQRASMKSMTGTAITHLMTMTGTAVLPHRKTRASKAQCLNSRLTIRTFPFEGGGKV